MIHAEYLKLTKNRQNVIFFILWAIISLFIGFLTKIGEINKGFYGILDNQEDYFVRLHFYLKTIYLITFLFIGFVMNISINSINTLNIKNKIITLPKSKSELGLAQLITFHLVFSTIFFLANIVTSISFLFLFGANISISKLISLTCLIWLGNIIGVMAVVSFFHIILMWIKKSIISIIVCVSACLFSIICPIKIMPLQWASSLIPISSANTEMNCLYLFLCLLTIYFSYFKLNFRFYKIAIFVFFSTMLYGCGENNKLSVTNNFTPKNNIVYIAFSLECNICIDELTEINKNSNQLDLKKIEILTIDSEKEIKSYFKTAGINTGIKVTPINQETIGTIYGNITFPQAIIFNRNKKIEIAKGYLKIDRLLLYAKK